jgi:hypothetical protein
MSNSLTDLLVIVVSHNHLPVLKTCLASLFSIRWNVSFEVLVIENTGRDGTREWVRACYPQVHTLQNQSPQGFAANVNHGITAFADSRYVLLINPDCECLPGLLDQLVEFMDDNSNVGIAGPMLLNVDGSVQPSCRRFSTPGVLLHRALHLDVLGGWFASLHRYLMNDFDHRSIRDVDWVTGALLIVRRASIAAVGLMDDRYFLYSEDQDWCCRMWHAGWRVCYLPQARARHLHMREGMKKPWRRAGRYQLVSAFRMFHKFGWRLDRNDHGKTHEP